MNLATLFRLMAATVMLEEILAQSDTSAPVSQTTSSSDFVARSWRTEDGLPQNSVNALLQTRDGFLWVGTNGGVGRFDGVSIRNFGLQDGLRSIWILSLAEDRDGKLWAGTSGGGLSRWDDGRFTSFGAEKGFPAGTDVISLAADRDGSLWIGTGKGLVHAREGTFTMIGESVGLPQKQIRKVLQDSRGDLWVAVIPGGLYRGSGGRFVKITGPSRDVYSLMEDRAGAIWAGTNLFVWKQGEPSWTRFGQQEGLPETDFVSLASGSDSSVWVGARNGGLFRWSGTRFERPVNEGPLLDQFVNTLMADRQGLIWAGPVGGGLHRLSPRILHCQGVAEGLPPAGVASVMEDASGSLWAATRTGVYRCQDGRFSKINDPALSGASPFAYCIAATGDGAVWAAGEQCVYRFQQGQPTKVFTEPPVRGEAVRAICPSGDALWLGTYYSALLKCDANGVHVVEPAGTFPGGITSLAIEGADAVWVGTSEGLHRWEKGNLKTWNTSDGLLTANIQALHRDADGTLWLGTLGGGLARLKDGHIVNITARHGLIDESIVQIVADDFGCLWLGCNRGLQCVDRRELEEVAMGKSAEIHPVVFGKNDGMPSEQCASGHSPTAIKLKDGRLCFPAAGGLVTIDPRRLRDLIAVTPQASIQDIRVDRQPALNVPLVIPPGSHRLEVNYTAPVLHGGEWVRFRHRLDGLDKGWVAAGHNRQASYDGLTPGRYVFRVSAADGKGNWNDSPAALSFSVQPFFWQTTWFRGGGIVLLTGLSGAAVWWHTRRQHVRQLAELERDRRQQTELARLSRISSLGELSGSLAHELSQPLGIILSNAQAAQRMLEGEQPDLAEVREILTDIVSEDRRAGEVIKRLRALLKRGETNFQTVFPHEIIEEVLRLMRSDLIGRGVTVCTELTDAAPSVLGDHVQLQQVVLNLIINACDAMAENPAAERILRISTSIQHTAVRVSFEDQGCGLPDEDCTRIFQPFFTTKVHGLGIGLAICRSIVKAHRGHLWAEPNTGRGTTFHMQLNLI